MSYYHTLIEKTVPGCNPAEVEAVMRCYHSTLDHLDRREFTKLAKKAAKELLSLTPDERARLARSF